MAANQTVRAFQVSLVKEGDGFAQKLEVQGGVGAGAPQISAIVIRAMKGNGGVIFVGGSAAQAAAAAGFELAAGDALSLDIEGTGGIWISGTKAADRVCVAGVGP